MLMEASSAAVGTPEAPSLGLRRRRYGEDVVKTLLLFLAALFSVRSRFESKW
jgi:hypothetical protein